MNEEWCREKLEKLQIIETRTDTLNEIKNQIVHEPVNQIVLNFIQSPELLDCCNSSTSSTEQTNLACDILSICMSNINLEQSQTAHSVLERALNNANPKVQSIGIKELSRILDLAGTSTSIVDESLINSLFKCLQSPDTKVGTPTIEILVKILPNVIDMNVVRENVEKTFSCDDVVRCRTYEVAIKLAQQSPALHAKLEYVLDRVISDLDSPDMLLQMNVLALLADLPLKQHGLVYLENKNIFNILLKKIDSVEQNPRNGLMAPGLIRFFGSVASKHPEKVFNGYPNVITLLFECLNSEDRAVLPTAFDTLSHLSRTTEGKKQLDNVSGNKMKEALKSIADQLPGFPTELKIRALNTLEAVFSNSDALDNQIASITQSWYETLAPTGGLTFVMNYCKNPFPEFKLAGLAILKAIVGHQWGQEALLQTGGFIEYLLDRRVDNNKDAALDKYEVVQILAESPVFDAHQLLQLKRYVSEGAFYLQGIMEVAVDGAA